MEVRRQLQGINDLVSQEAPIHNTNFKRGTSDKAGGKNGRKWLEGEMEHCLLTLDHLHQKLIEFDEGSDKSLAYSKRYLKSKLEEKYEDRIYFTSQERRSGILCFKDLTSNILRDHQQNEGDDDEQIFSEKKAQER